MKKKILMLLFLLVFNFVSITSAGMHEKSNSPAIGSNTIQKNLNILKDAMVSGKADKYVSERLEYADGSREIILKNRENLASHDHFDWNWAIHYVAIRYRPGVEGAIIAFTNQEYQNFVTPRTMGRTLWILLDNNFDGRVDMQRRDFTVLMETKKGIGYETAIVYPNGFVNTGWYNPPQEEQNKKFKSELDYWLKTLNLS